MSGAAAQRLPLEGMTELALRLVPPGDLGDSGAVSVIVEPVAGEAAWLEVCPPEAEGASIELSRGATALAALVRPAAGRDGRVRLGIPAHLTALALELDRGSVEASGLECRRLSALVKRGDILLRRYGGFLVASVGRGALNLEGLKGETLASVGWGQVSCFSCGGVLRLHVGDGSLTISDFRGATVELRGEKASVKAANAETDCLALEGRQISADVETAIARRLIVRAEQLDLSFRGLLGDGEHRVTAEQGCARLVLPETAPLKFDLSTGGGNLRCAFPGIEVGRRGRPSSGGRRLVGRWMRGTVELGVSLGRGDVCLLTYPVGATGAKQGIQSPQQAGGTIGRQGHH
ncbi:MAG: hypothetical protein HPY83_15935 [Anaerolineae bacterium]|nr:hypothetical protein [Anaerolineae bacterium]